MLHNIEKKHEYSNISKQLGITKYSIVTNNDSSHCALMTVTTLRCSMSGYKPISYRH